MSTSKSERFMLEDILLCDPVSKRGKEALARVTSKTNGKTMSLKDFYEQVYIEPFFIDFPENEENEDLYMEYNDFFDFAFSELGALSRNLNDKKMQYENLFFSQNSDMLFLIRAAAGSGKSIYLNHLKRERRKLFQPEKIDLESVNGQLNDANEINFDLEQSTSKITYGWVSFPSDDYKLGNNSPESIKAPWCFFIMLLDSLFNIVYSILSNKNSDEYRNFINNFNIIYGNNYEREIEALYNFAKDKTVDDNDNHSVREYSSALFTILINMCFKEHKNVSSCIICALESLTRLIAVKSDIKSAKQTLISFDNIEHFIDNKKRIYDSDIRLITSSVIKFAQNEERHYQKIGLNFASYFKIILVVRDTTNKMLPSDVHTYFNQNNCSVDVTGWYSLEKIYESKLRYFPIDATTSSINFFNLIINDSLKTRKNNLMEQIASMYNHNNRRTTHMLIRISGIFEQKENYPCKNKGSLNYEQYKKLWEWKEKNHIRFLCRQSVLRLIYNEIADTYFFDRICSCSSSSNKTTTYARRIVTWLANKESHKQEEYFSFCEILRKVYCCPGVGNKKISYKDVLEISKVLVALDEHRFSYPSEIYKYSIEPCPNRWCQLIIIKFNVSNTQGKLTAEMLAKRMLYEYENGFKDSDNFGIRLTEAGAYFAQMLREFEYFSCRYAKADAPLIFMLDKEQIKNTLELVYTNAKECIDNTILFEGSFFKWEYSAGYKHLHHLRQKNTYQSYVYRILKRHIDYLRAYRLYLKDDILHNEIKLFKDSDRNEIINCIDDFICGYEDIWKQIRESEYEINAKKIENYELFLPYDV